MRISPGFKITHITAWRREKIGGAPNSQHNIAIYHGRLELSDYKPKVDLQVARIQVEAQRSLSSPWRPRKLRCLATGQPPTRAINQPGKPWSGSAEIS